MTFLRDILAADGEVDATGMLPLVVKAIAGEGVDVGAPVPVLAPGTVLVPGLSPATDQALEDQASRVVTAAIVRGVKESQR